MTWHEKASPCPAAQPRSRCNIGAPEGKGWGLGSTELIAKTLPPADFPSLNLEAELPVCVRKEPFVTSGK
jgi:hypothetical protein